MLVRLLSKTLVTRRKLARGAVCCSESAPITATCSACLQLLQREHEGRAAAAAAAANLARRSTAGSRLDELIASAGVLICLPGLSQSCLSRFEGCPKHLRVTAGQGGLHTLHGVSLMFGAPE